MSEHIHFISDLHLSDDRSDITQCFLSYLSTLDSSVSSLYILGDFFDVWVGDDDQSSPIPKISNGLKEAVKKGLKIFFQPGNRDFLIGDVFLKNTGLIPLADETLIDLFGKKILLMHGDLLCTDDVEYQQFRALSHSQQWKNDLLSKPLQERLAIGQHYRHQSHRHKENKSAAIMDVNSKTVIKQMQKHQALTLIHGHTHRPAVHDFVINGQPAQRIVLAEWDEKGSVLDWTEQGYTIKALKIK